MNLRKKLDKIFMEYFAYPLAAVWRDNNPLRIRLSQDCIACVKERIPKCNVTECKWRYDFYFRLKDKEDLK